MEFALRGIQLALQIGNRTGLSRRRPPPSEGGDQLPPGVKQVGVDAQLLTNYRSRLAAIEPVLDRLAFEGFVEFAMFSDSCLFHGSSRSLSTRFSVRQFEATSKSLLCSLRGLLFRSVFLCDLCGFPVTLEAETSPSSSLQPLKKLLITHAAQN